MSDAKAPIQDSFDISVCSQCTESLLQSKTRDARHAIPCGHVFCKDCLSRVEAEQKFGKSACCRPGCGQELAPQSEFPIAWCTQRATRVFAGLEHMLRDQGNAGDSPAVEAEPTASLCGEHKLPLQAVESSTHRPVCAQCLETASEKVQVQSFDEAIAALQAEDIAIEADVDKHIRVLAEPTFTPDELCVNIATWRVQQTKRIRAWEEREVKQIHAVADESVKRVEEVCERRIEVGASLFTQRVGLRASLEELNLALADLPNDPASRLSKKRAVCKDRKQLCDLLGGYKMHVPSTQEVLHWAELQDIISDFDSKSEGVLANAVLGAARTTLSNLHTYSPGVRSFPRIPKLVGY